MKQTTKIYSAIAISSAFFIVEIVLGFRQRSLALVADAFHVASDIIGFVVALVARILADRKTGIPRRSTSILVSGGKRVMCLGQDDTYHDKTDDGTLFC
jgi:hypothetical protein